LLDLVKNVVTSNLVNAIHCELPILAHIQDKLVKLFPATKFWYCKTRVADIVRRDEQKEIMIIEHNRAHRADQENVKQVLLDYYFPKMGKIATEVVVNCRVCEKAKYDRHPKKIGTWSDSNPFARRCDVTYRYIFNSRKIFDNS